MKGCNILEFQERGDSRGKLVALEGEKEIPFAIKRAFYIYGADGESVRGLHSNRNSEFTLICLNGSCMVKTDDGFHQVVHTLNRPSMGLYIPAMVWKEMYSFSADCVLLSLSSHPYDDQEYIRDYDTFLQLIRG